MNNRNLHRKCMGIAKNYFTNSLKNNPQQVTLPQYPYMFSKTLSSYLFLTKIA